MLLRGYALEPAPLFTSDLITSVNVSIVRDDDPSYIVSGPATYGNSAFPRYDACGGNGVTGPYPGSPGCPNVNFDFTWNTGVSSVTDAFMPNAVYTATFSTSDSSSPPLSSAISGTFAVDNQTPAPAIISPVNGVGAYGVEQSFVVTYTSPHTNLDFANGQISFQGPSTTCVVQWTMPATITVLSGSSTCTLDSGRSSLSNNGTNQLTVTLGLTFASSMLGQVVVSAFGTNSIGEVGPWSTITDYAVTGAPASQVYGSLPYYPFPDYLVIPPGVTGGVCESVLFVNGAQGPVTVGTPQIIQQSGVQSSLYFSASPSPGVSSPVACPSGSILNIANGAETGASYLVNYTITDASGDTALEELYVVVSSAPQFNVSAPTPAQDYTALQGTSSLTIPITVTPQGNFTGNVTLTATGSQSGISASFSPSSLYVTPSSSGTSNMTVSVSPTLAPGQYSVYVQGTGPSGTYPTAFYVWVAVTMAPDYSIGAITSESIQAGQSINFTGEIVPVPFSGFSGTVTLTGLSPGAAPGISLPDSVSISSGPQSFTGTVTSTASTVNCTYTLPVSAISGSIQHSSSFTVSVQGGAAPYATPSWGGVTVTSASAVSFAVSATATSCFSGAASFAVSGFPSGIQFTFPSPSPTITGPVSPTSPVNAGNVSVNVSSSVTPQAYTGTLTVTLGGVAYSQPLVVTVAPVVTATPSYTLSCTNCGSGLTVTQSAPGTVALIAITRQNGYTYNPVLWATSLPTGVSVSFDNSATESAATNNVVGATVTASAAAPLGTFPLVVLSWDSVSPSAVALTIMVTVNPPTLSVGSSVTYTMVNPANHTPTVATVTATAMGGIPPYSYTLSRDIAWGPVWSAAPVQYSMSGFTSDRHALLIVTDSSPSPQTVSKNVLIPAPQAYPDYVLQVAVLNHVSAVESLASTLQALGDDPTGVRSALQGRLGITNPALYCNAPPAQPCAQSSLVGLASQLQAARGTNAVAFQSAENTLHSNALTAATAPAADLTPIGNVYTSDQALAQTYASSVTGLMGSSFDQNEWNLLGPELSDCDPEYGCDPCDDLYEICGEPVAFFFWGTFVDVDPATQLLEADTFEVLFSEYPVDSDSGLCVGLSVNLPIAGGKLSNCSTNEAATASVLLFPEPGTYTVTGTTQPFYGYFSTEDGETPFSLPAFDSQVTVTIAQTCTSPVITGVLVNGEPTSVLQASSTSTRSGTLNLLGCFPGSSPSLSFDGSGVSVSNVSGTPGAISASYSVSVGTQPGTLFLTVTDSTGNATIAMQLAPSLPYISSIFPPVWPAGYSTNVTIQGAGFGTLIPNVSVLGSLSGSDENWTTLSWTDTTITGQVNPPSNAVGDVVSVKVTSYGYGSNFAPAPQQGNQSSPAQAKVMAPCSSAQIIEETVSPGTLPVYNPATIRQGFAPLFQATLFPSNCTVQWSVTGAGSIIGSSTSSLVTVNGNSVGTATLQATAVGGFISQIQVPVTTQQNFQVRAMIVAASDGSGAATTGADVTADIANANLVWQQAGVQFNLVSVGYVNNSAYLSVNNTQRVALTNTLTGTGGFEVYYVPVCVDNIDGQEYPTGIVICVNRVMNEWNTAVVASSLNTTLAHELGHAGGLMHASADPPAAKNINLMFPSALANGLQADITIGQVNALSFTPSQ
jgi:hypothetical protein